MSERLSEKLVKATDSSGKPQLILWDSETKGFGLRVTRNGAKAFLLDYRAGGRQRRITIGRYPDWSVSAARAQARELKQAINRGDDPMGERHRTRASPTLTDLWQLYQTEHLARLSERSQADQESMWRKLILPSLGKKRLIDLTQSDIGALHRKITDKGTPVRANRVVEVLRKALFLACDRDWIERNPAVGVARNREEQRHRYLTQAELRDLFDALDEHAEPVSANAIRFLALTGARKSEVLKARWDMFDLAAGVWTKPAGFTKQRRMHRVPLSDAACEVLKRMACQSTGQYVFPGRAENEPLKDIKKSWESVCTKAGLVETVQSAKDGTVTLKPNVRIHDLRHSFASVLASGGTSLPIIGALLGHTQTQTTQRYAHLYDDALREAANSVSNKLSETDP